MFAAILAGCRGEADFSGTIETQILPAEQYQHDIMTIDRLLFQERPIGEEGRHGCAAAERLDARADAASVKPSEPKAAIAAPHFVPRQ